METTRAIRFLSVFVVGVVTSMGCVMIYAVASQPRYEQPGFTARQFAAPMVVTESPRSSSPVSQATQSAAPAFRQASQPITPPSGSVVHVPLPQRRDIPAAKATDIPVTAPEPATQAVDSPPAESSNGSPSTAHAPASRPTLVAATNLQSFVKEPAPSAHTATRQPHTVTLWMGTPLTVRLTQAVSTDSTKPGQYFNATLQEPIVRDGFIIAEAGSGVTGKVVASKHAGMFHRAPELRLVLVGIRTTDNQVVPIVTAPWDDRGQYHNRVTGTVRSAFGAVSGAFGAHGNSLLAESNSVTDGRNILMPVNATLQFPLAAPVTITEHTH